MEHAHLYRLMLTVLAISILNRVTMDSILYNAYEMD